MSAVDPSGRALVIPGGGSSLPTAAGANEVPASTGAGTTYTAVTVPALLASVSNTRGRLLRRGASAWEALDASTADTFVGGDGTDVTTRTAAQVRASILGPFADPMTGSGWSTLTTSGGASASWGSSKLTLDCAAGSAGSCGVEASSYLESGEWWDLAIRLDVLSGDASSSTRINLVAGQDTNNNVTVSLWTNGTLEVGYVSSGSWQSITFGSVSGIDSTARTGGQLWLRIARTPTGLSWWWGVGSGGAMPTQWQYYYSLMEVAAAGYAGRVSAAMTASSGRYVQISALTLFAVDLDVDVLAISRGLSGAFGG